MLLPPPPASNRGLSVVFLRMMSAEELAPGLLLAGPALHDPNFSRTVILLGRNDKDGSLGWVINGRELMTVRELLASSDLASKGISIPEGGSFSRLACVGGPVAPAAGWLIYPKQPEALPGELAVGPELAVSGELAAFSAVTRGLGPNEFRLVLGCAGWAPGQLENEIATGSWLPAPIDRELIFKLPLDQIWDQGYQRTIGSSPASFTNRRGKA